MQINFCKENITKKQKLWEMEKIKIIFGFRMQKHKRYSYCFPLDKLFVDHWIMEFQKILEMAEKNNTYIKIQNPHSPPPPKHSRKNRKIYRTKT